MKAKKLAKAALVPGGIGLAYKGAKGIQKMHMKNIKKHPERRQKTKAFAKKLMKAALPTAGRAAFAGKIAGRRGKKPSMLMGRMMKKMVK